MLDSEITSQSAFSVLRNRSLHVHPDAVVQFS
jgi:hypothetical protein